MGGASGVGGRGNGRSYGGVAMTAIALFIGFGALTGISVMAFLGAYWFEYWGGDE